MNTLGRRAAASPMTISFYSTALCRSSLRKGGFIHTVQEADDGIGCPISLR
ncbi:MAG: hypothetical protein RMM17_02160 [Acidobacteriota bacterium]|nr:hypothetical protein [Blastocatellia bacterium]MDW8411473.1 hypothetical protein [Acidobacteriota bacterium]